MGENNKVKMDSPYEVLLEAAQELVENKGPCLDGFVRHVGDHYVEALEDALKKIKAMR